MQLKDLVKPIDQMSEEELLDHLRAVRHRRTVEKPVAKAREQREEKKESRGRMSAVDKLLAGLSPEEQAALLSQLEGKSSNGGSSEGNGGNTTE